MRAGDLFAEHLADAAVSGPSGEFSGIDLRARAEAAGAVLRSAGLRPGHVVGVVLPQDLDLVVALLATWAAGGVPLPIDARVPRAEIASTLARAGAAVAVAVGDPGIAWASFSPAGGLDVRGRLDGPQRPDGEALLLGTSGTIGRPKIAVVTASTIRAIRDRFPLGPDQTFLAALPLAHAFGLFVALLAPLARGARVVLTEWTDPGAAVDFASKHGATVMPAVPRMIGQLMRADLPDLGTIRAIVVGGAPARTEELVALQERYGILVGYGYGMTETAAVTTLNLHLAEKPGSVGRPFPGVQIKIAGTNGQPVSAGRTGEVWLRDTALSSGYVGEGPVTRSDGWLQTGDLGFVDDEGYLSIVGRAKEIIITSGYNVVPGEVEDVLASFPGIEEAAVFGRPDRELGEEIVAIVVPSLGDPIDVDALREYAREHLAHYKVPRAIRVERRVLPRTLVGKLSRWRLAQEVT